jgi:protocatechuate 3,4-dioxygenase beta subunit
MELFRIPGVILTAMPNKRFAVVFFALLPFAIPSLAAITGSVMTSDGKPVAGARVSTYASEPAEARRARLLSDQPEPIPLATVQTDAKGAFSVESPKTAVTTLRVSMRGYVPKARTVERDDDAVVFVLEKAEPRNAKVTAAGKPVANATVVLSYGGVEEIARTDAEGRYDATPARDLTSITVVHPEYAIEEEFFFGLSTNAQRAKLDRTLVKGTPLTGRVVSSDGKTPVAGAAIALNNWPAGTSAEDGSFTIARAPSKWESLIARKDGLIAYRVFGKDTTLRLEKAATFSGRVTDAKTKLPLAGARVTFGSRRMDTRFDLNLTADADAKGTFSFTAPAGSYAVSVAHPAYEGDNSDVTAAAGQTNARDFALQPLARVSGVVVDEGNKPVAAATIVPEATGDPMAMIMRGGGRFMREFAQTSSGPDGKFSLRMAGDREVKIRAAKKGLPAGRTDGMKLGPGERRNNVMISLPSGVLVTGKVVDADGNPLSGAFVSAGETPGRGSDGGGIRRQTIMIGTSRGDDDSVQTASDGTFSIRLKEGVYDFTARRDGYSAKVVRAYTVNASGAEPLEMKLDPAVQISGRVVRGGTGLEGVSLFVFGGGSGDSNSATTGPDGTFVLDNLTPGQVGIFVTKPGDFIQEQRTLTAPATDVVLEFPTGGRVTGRVVEKGTRRPVTAFDAGITRSRGGGAMVMMGPPQTKPFTSDDGSFVLENVPAGSATLVASAPGFVTGRLNVTVEEGKSLDDVVVELDTGVKLSGKVTGPNGAPLPDVTVRVAPSPTGGFAMSGRDSRATTDSNGEYSIDSLTPGDETITFTHAKYLATSKQVTLKGRETRLDAQLEGGTRVTGIVVTEAGAPVADAEVRAIAPGAGMPSSVTTNANGAFEFESLSNARYRFTASRVGYADGVVEDYDVAAGGGQLRITLKTGGTIYGRVTGLTEQDLANTFVTARSSGSSSTTPVDSTGSYRIEGAPVGNVQVSANVRGMVGGSRTSPAQTVSLTAGSSAQVDLAFRSDVAVRGRVTRNGTPLGNAQVMFAPRLGGQSSSATTDSAGNYSIAGLEDGHYMVNVIDMGRLATYSTSYEVRGSSTFDIDYSVATVRGRVVEAGNNRPISGANVAMRATSSVELFRGRGAVTDENGVFAIDTVPQGTYSITASLTGYGSASKDVSVGESNLDNVELHLAQSDGVTLSVVDGRDGRPLRAAVTLYDGAGREVQTSGSQFILGGDTPTSSINVPAAPGQYVASVYTQNYAPVHMTVNAPSTRTVALTPGGRIDIESKHGEQVRVQLIDTMGIPYPRIGPLPRKYTLVPRVVTPLERIAPGRYTLQLLGPDDTTVIDQVQVIVSEGQTARVEI